MSSSTANKTESAIQKQIGDEVNKFNALRTQFKKIISMRSQLEIQLNENKLVKEELELLSDDAKTFKLIGPALIRIDLKEAKENVNNRIKYINEELKRHDKTMETLREQQETHKQNVLKLEEQAGVQSGAK